ncbi:alpha-tocopherol transfer protein-like isoform X2 [Daktulosphaira vitifoliae]|uniref:alpha-tocopherol transfer protein-like isoform X2 n=1 Tax=Daktulosphaira vitifoliae TaxID=58002 RepID=UPI0021A9FD86|nr:alpha-tocopherol transfer protein-like isoform X2 [Daktulosphaira vitifoliae]
MGVGYDSDEENTIEECPLADDLKLVAKQELREDDDIRTHSLRAMRNWIKKHPDIINCRTDAPFLLRFLRTKKFSVPMAQEMLERYLVIRQLYPQWYQKLDIEDPLISDIIDSGFLIPLPGRDEFGRCVLFSSIGRFDPYKYTADEMIRAYSLISESLLDDPENQIKGYNYTNDESGMLMGHLTIWSFTNVKRIIRILQNSIPMRHKASYFINVPNFADKFFTITVSFLSNKLKSRFFTGQKELQECIDPKYLPKEYGGEIPLATMIADLKKKLQSQRDKLLALDDMKININSKGKIISEFDDIQEELVGSFRKLEVD